MASLLELDGPLYDEIFSLLSSKELLQVSLSCRTLKKLVESARLAVFTDASISPTQFPVADHHPDADFDWWCNKIQEKLALQPRTPTSCLSWLASLNIAGLRSLRLDHTRVVAGQVLDLIGGSGCPLLGLLSIRFCIGIHAKQVNERLASLVSKGSTVALQRLNLIGISGLCFFDPEKNFVEADDVSDFSDTGEGDTFPILQDLLKRVQTVHGGPILTDVAWCKQCAYGGTIVEILSSAFDMTHKELADPTAVETLSPCLVCETSASWSLCRRCILPRSCLICDTFVCPDCLPLFEEREIAQDALAKLMFSDPSPASRNCRNALECLRGFDESELGYRAVEEFNTHCLTASQEAAQIALDRSFVLDEELTSPY